jgi:hypothetical protein
VFVAPLLEGVELDCFAGLYGLKVSSSVRQKSVLCASLPNRILELKGLQSPKSFRAAKSLDPKLAPAFRERL